MIILLLLVVVAIFQGESARILGIIPVASYSHQVPFQALWKELSLRGHQLTVMTTNPVNDPSLKNLTEIDLSFTYKIYEKYNFTENISDDNKSFLEIAEMLKIMLSEAGEYQLNHPQVQNLIKNKDVHFDLVIVEAQLPGMMAFSWRFNCPMIGISSLDSGIQYHMAMGNPVHPIVNPDINLPVQDPEELTFKERIASFVYYIGYSYVLYEQVYPALHIKLKTIFGNDIPDPLALHDNMQMLFINTHSIFHSIRPLNPSTIPIGGGIHLKIPQPLPKDIQKYMDNAEEGVIYFSLGTNVNARMVNDMMPEILKALNELPYKILFKTDHNLKNVPDNVAIHKWLPQQDILRHPNLKLFITQGGLQSLQEAVYNAVPLVAIPFLGDQIANANKMVKQGYGLKIDKRNVTKISLKEAALEVIDNPRYRERVKELSSIFRDEEVPSLQRAIYWTEYVLKHKGTRHFRNPVIDMPLWKYYMIDVIGLLLSVHFLLVFVCYRVIRFLFMCFRIIKTKLFVISKTLRKKVQ